MKRTLAAIFTVFALFEFNYVLAATKQPQSMGFLSTNINVSSVVSQVNVSTKVPISPTATYMAILSTGGVVNFASNSSYPAVSTSTAVNGQYLVLFSTSSACSIGIATGSATGVVGTDAFIFISSTRSAAQFIYNSTLSQWVEIGKQ